MMNLTNLESVRAEMLEELENDRAGGALYRSPRLTDTGWNEYPAVLREAIQSHDSGWLENEIRRRRLLKQQELRRTKSSSTMVKVPITAAETLADGEFNRFYIRGLCRSILEAGNEQVTIYRAKSVENPRSESRMLIGTTINARELLDDLRRNSSDNPSLGVPGGPNSGLSIRWP